jgi:hypothetical protein
MQITYDNIVMFLSVIALLMLIVLLYHLIFVSVSIRRMTERWDEISKEVEGLILKPIGAIDYMLEWFSSMVEGMQEEKHKKVHHKRD